MTSAIVAQLASATDKLTAAQQSADDYLDSVSDVRLARPYSPFAETPRRRSSAMPSSTRSCRRQSTIEGAIQDLGDTLDAVTVKVIRHVRDAFANRRKAREDWRKAVLDFVFRPDVCPDGAVSGGDDRCSAGSDP